MTDRQLPASISLRAAYATCRAIAKREAKNFYYAFRVLPQHKSDAMCAVYAFMRRADDLADDETQSRPERRHQMAAWLDAWRTAQAGGSSVDPVFCALLDTQQRFHIPSTLLEELVQGTSMDLAETGSGTIPVTGGLQGYRTFDDLYRYCYLVASVVGLVCIRIFGYTDSCAEQLAEHTGIAFQLTNILRDIKEDAERGRVYIPLDLMREFHVEPGRILALANGEPLHPNERALLHSLELRAEQYYRAAASLLPLIDRDSRAALWVMVTIYHRLLKKIAARNGDVFSQRVSVPTSAKLAILVQGALQSTRNRL